MDASEHGLFTEPVKPTDPMVSTVFQQPDMQQYVVCPHTRNPKPEARSFEPETHYKKTETRQQKEADPGP